MGALTYLNPGQNYRSMDVPAAVAVRASEFLAQHAYAEIQTVYSLGGNRWQFAYAVNRNTKKHAEYRYDFTVTA